MDVIGPERGATEPEACDVIGAASRLGRSGILQNYQQHLNPRIATLAELAGLDNLYVRADGLYLWDDRGNRYLDFLGGYGATGLGHNHPRLREALAEAATLPNLIHGLNPWTGALAERLAALAPGALERVNFANSGAEAVDVAIKLARAATGRSTLVACRNGFHGRTIGALSLMQRPALRRAFDPLLADVTWAPFGDLNALERALRGRDVAGFIVEPIQGEGGIVVPPEGYLRAARALCARYGALFIADEIQTGLGRTGTLFAVEHEGVVPDVLLLGKILGGGVMPISAVLTTDAIFRAASGGTVRTPFATSTYGGNTLACVAGLAALEVLCQERLPERAAESGAYLLERLRGLARRQPLIAEVRGRGLMVGVEFTPATRGLARLLTAGLLDRVSHTYFGGYVVMRLMTRHRIITASPLNNPTVLRLEPSLTVEREHLDAVVAALDETLRECGSFARLAVRNAPRLLRALRA